MTALENAYVQFTQHIIENPYPGRGLVIGKTENNGWVIIYWIMGRSRHSQNRRFVTSGHILRTEPIDSTLVEDPSLIIYEAMLELPNIYLVSNGDQTRTIHNALRRGDTFDDALSTREREPDVPNYTPRISGMLSINDKMTSITLSILKANQGDPSLTDRFTYRPALPAKSVGYGLTTYIGDGTPLPSFTGDPLLLPCKGDGQEILETYWNALDEKNRVSLAVKTIDAGKSNLLIKNKYGT